MADWTGVRYLARERHREAAEAVGGDLSSLTASALLLQAALDREGLYTLAADANDPALAGAHALLDREALSIVYNPDLPDEIVRFNQAHELAHWWLHDEQAEREPCRANDIVPDPLTEPLPYSQEYVSGYSPAQKREMEANIFAAEFLLPATALRAAFLAGQTPDQIAAQIGVTESVVLGQMAEALLVETPAGRQGEEERGRNNPTPNIQSKIQNPKSKMDALDASQRAAAELEQGPALIVAGPGTGKTRTLIARVQYLLERGTPPEKILALTFSNRAANEMRERLEMRESDAARRIWIGTFHAFGLELLRRYGVHLGLPPAPTLIDPLDAIGLLESHLADLNLREYEYLHNPTFPFRDLLSAISRAKDELVTPEQYAALVDAMEDPVPDPKSKIQNPKSKMREVAGVYRVWQQILQQEGKLDFGDLLMRAVELLQNHPDVHEEVQAQYREILVDEYQDINRASAVLVQLVAGNGAGLWAVGDLRQAIYRFRGASAANLHRFEEDYPAGRRLSLAVNYRSRPPIVQLFGQAAGGETGSLWQAQRSAGTDAIIYAEAENEAAQADGIANAAHRFEALGIPLREQAILCRTNAQAESLAALLEARGVPILFLGDLLTRPEIRDMLALLSLANGEGHGQGLARIAERFPEYAASPEEVQALLTQARDEKILFPDALKASGVPAFERLFHHLQPLAWRGDASAFFQRYLFGPADYLRRLLREDTTTHQQARLALYQLLLEARGLAKRLGSDAHPQRSFLAHIRRLLALQEDTRARLPAAAEEIDGLRLLTVHASKGLEFPVVFLPNLAKELFPPRRRSGLTQPPRGLFTEMGETEEDEEARLFFVALSRARDHLVLSRPLTVHGKPRDRSYLLEKIEKALDTCGAQRVQWADSGFSSNASASGAQRPTPNAQRPTPDTEFTLPAVEQYMRCPRQYYYQHVRQLPRVEEESAYRAFQMCIWNVVRHLREEKVQGRTLSEALAERRLAEEWEKIGPGEHPYAPLFRLRASEMLTQFQAMEMEGELSSTPISELVAELPAGRIRIRLDHAEETPEGALRIERYDSGRPADDDHTAPRLALTRHAARQARQSFERSSEHRGGPTNRKAPPDVEIRLRYFSTGETRPVPEQPRWEPARVAKYAAALEGIREAEFPPKPSQEQCGRCPFFFLCPS